MRDDSDIDMFEQMFGPRVAYISKAQAAQYFQLDEKTVMRNIIAMRLPVRYVGVKSVRIPKSTILALVR